MKIDKFNKDDKTKNSNHYDLLVEIRNLLEDIFNKK